MKRIFIAGNIGRDAETRRASDTEVTSFPVAVKDGWGAKERTLWFDCSIWGQRGTKIADYLTKGKPVAVAGEMSTREHDGKTYLTIRVDDVKFWGGANQDTAPQRQPADDLGGDEIPF